MTKSRRKRIEAAKKWLGDRYLLARPVERRTEPEFVAQLRRVPTQYLQDELARRSA